MKSFALAALLPLLAAAGPLKRQDTTTPPFTVTSVRSGSPIQYLSLEAREGKFWLGGSPGTYCPETTTCPPGNETVIAGINGLDVAAPGGQQIYVLPSGELSFTQTHSANIPAGAATGPFEYGHEGATAKWSFSGLGSKGGFVACPIGEGTSTQWQVYADVPNLQAPNGNANSCLGFDTIAETWPGTGAAAWEYI
ncbi:IgE-binding protein [Paecilomyces variotii No. 5]|uniref:IgE-binding protein n=1 Tax=Byssochlamys spectabilis (strain No. 5 / NBRC 109023) TaxID=1356009 RepID=V5FKJ0_BYSSN|nr:IgE-binding protein [Paecilomyces variotii No. 5]